MEHTKKPDLYLITQDYPYGHLEDSFVGPEYPYLCERFHVSMIAAEVAPTAKLRSEEEVGEKGMEACVIRTGQSVAEKLFSLCRFLLEKDCYTELASILKSGEKIPQRIYRALMFGAAAETFYRRLKKKISLTKNTRALFYFYWFDYKCFGLVMHRRRFPNIKIVSRTHGYELYDERELYGRQFFKPQTDAGLTRLIFAAQFAKDYYLTRYRLPDGEKYPLYRLGVQSQGVTGGDRRAAYRGGGEFLLLSCSDTGQVKRIDRIIDGLAAVTTAKIHWVHIGGGENLAGLREMAQKKLDGKDNIRYEFAGTLLNTEVIAYYRTHYVGCMITTTQSEGGSPVAVQEALSFGVPVIATAVGELRQMVEGNGILLSENPTAEETAKAVERMAERCGTEDYFRMCEKSLGIFEEKFNEKHNFSAFAAEMARVAEGRAQDRLHDGKIMEKG